MLAIGQGSFVAMQSDEAIAAAAAAATSHEAVAVATGLGFEAAQAVTVTPLDYGMDPAAGALVGLSEDEVVVERRV